MCVRERERERWVKRKTADEWVGVDVEERGNTSGGGEG